MSILLTGATGYIGSSVLPRLLDEGHAVTALVRDESKAQLVRDAGAAAVVGDATDGALVKAHLIRPLDDVVKAYDYEKAAGAAISQLEWSTDGKTFGSGSVYGMSPDNQMVGLFYNKAKLQKLGLGAPTTLDELTSALAAAKAAGETPIVLGNSDKGSAMQAFSVVQGALSPAKDTVGWVTGKSGADFDTEAVDDAILAELNRKLPSGIVVERSGKVLADEELA